MIKCLTEEWIELLAIDHLIDPGANLPDHLSTCKFCKAAFDAMVELHRTAAQTLANTELDSFTELINSKIFMNDPHVYRLHSMYKKPVERPALSYRKTLAADTDRLTLRPSSVENLGVFASSDGQLIVRILKAADGKVSLFLLADEESMYKHVLVRILGMDREYITNMKGSAYLGEIELPDIHELGIEVRTATESYALGTIFPVMESLIGESEIVLSGDSARQIKMEIIPAGGLYSLRVTMSEKHTALSSKQIKVMVVRDNHLPLVKSSVHGVALFQELQDPRTVLVKIFE